jgi:hypothetical protein
MRKHSAGRQPANPAPESARHGINDSALMHMRRPLRIKAGSLRELLAVAATEGAHQMVPGSRFEPSRVGALRCTKMSESKFKPTDKEIQNLSGILAEEVALAFRQNTASPIVLRPGAACQVPQIPAPSRRFTGALWRGAGALRGGNNPVSAAARRNAVHQVFLRLLEAQRSRQRGRPESLSICVRPQRDPERPPGARARRLESSLQ